jgi:hypothetical protein
VTLPFPADGSIDIEIELYGGEHLIEEVNIDRACHSVPILPRDQGGDKIMKSLLMRLANLLGLCGCKPNTCWKFIECSDVVGKEFLRLHHPRESQVVLEPNGSISLGNSSGAILRLDAENNEIVIEDNNGNRMTMNSAGSKVEDTHGNIVEMDAAGISILAAKIVIKGSSVHLGDTGGEPIIKGQSFLALFATHIHTCAPVVGGPTSPPIPQGEATTLSTTVKTL